MARRGENWDQFIFAVLLHLILPLAPLGLEWMIIGQVKVQSITLGASMYAMSIGISSRRLSMLGLTILIGFFFAAAYGISISVTKVPPLVGYLAGAGILTVLVLHVIERYNRHVVDQAPFAEFLSRGK